MAKNNDLFPSSLPIYQSPPLVFDSDMTEAVNNDQNAFYSPPEYLFETTANTNFTNFAHGKTVAGSGALIAQSLESSPHDSSGDSQRSSMDSSDGSSADIMMGDRERTPGRIPIPADSSDPPIAKGNYDGIAKPIDELVIGNDLFDFDSAASSPVQASRDMASSGIKMPIRPAPNHIVPPFGYGPFSSGFNSVRLLLLETASSTC